MFSRDLKINRVKALQQLQDPRNAIEGVEKAITEYLSLFWGLLEDVAAPPKDGESSSASTGEAKLQKIETFKWSHSICGNTAMYKLAFFLLILFQASFTWLLFCKLSLVPLISFLM